MYFSTWLFLMVGKELRYRERVCYEWDLSVHNKAFNPNQAVDLSQVNTPAFASSVFAFAPVHLPRKKEKKPLDHPCSPSSKRQRSRA